MLSGMKVPFSLSFALPAVLVQYVCATPFENPDASITALPSITAAPVCHGCAFGPISASLLSLEGEVSVTTEIITVTAIPYISIGSHTNSTSFSYVTQTLTEILNATVPFATAANATAPFTGYSGTPLTWIFEDVTLTYPTTYAVFSSFRGGTASPTTEIGFGPPTTTCGTDFPRVTLGQTTDWTKLIVPTAGVTDALQLTAIPTQVMGYLDTLPALEQQFGGTNVSDCDSLRPVMNYRRMQALLRGNTTVPAGNQTIASSSAPPLTASTQIPVQLSTVGSLTTVTGPPVIESNPFQQAIPPPSTSPPPAKTTVPTTSTPSISINRNQPTVTGSGGGGTDAPQTANGGSGANDNPGSIIASIIGGNSPNTGNSEGASPGNSNSPTGANAGGVIASLLGAGSASAGARTPIVTVGGSVITANSNGGFSVAPGKTLLPGSSGVVIAGSTYSIPVGGSAIAINGITQTIAAVAGASPGGSPGNNAAGPSFTNAALPPLVVAGHTYTPEVIQGSTVYSIAPGTTLVPSGPALTIGGTTVSLAPSGSAVVINGQTSTLLPAAAPTLTVGGQTFSPITSSGTVVYSIAPGTTLTPGGKVTISGTVVSEAPGDSYLVVGSSTIFPAPASAATTTAGIGGFILTGLGASGPTTATGQAKATGTPGAQSAARSNHPSAESRALAFVATVLVFTGLFP